MHVHILQHDDWVEPGECLSWARRRGHDVRFTRRWVFDPLPTEPDSDLLIVLGGQQSPSTTSAECAYYDAAAEEALIRRYIESGRMVLGICLGAQLMGEALGAPYEHSPEREIGPVRARLTEAGRSDPFLRGFPDCFDAGAWHNDMPGLTPDAVVLAESDGCPRQIVRYGDFAYGFQAHMEFTHEIAVEGIRHSANELSEGGRFVQSEARLLACDYTEMNRLLAGFLDLMTEAYQRRAKACAPEN